VGVRWKGNEGIRSERRNGRGGEKEDGVERGERGGGRKGLKVDSKRRGEKDDKRGVGRCEEARKKKQGRGGEAEEGAKGGGERKEDG